MYTQSGELVIISGVRKYFKRSEFKSLRFRIIFLVILGGISPGVSLTAVVLKSYENRAVDVRTADIQNQCTILCNQLSHSGYLAGTASEMIRAELVQLSNIYNGRVMLIDQNYQVIEDTYDMDLGKTIVSGDVIRCFQGKGTSRYDRENRYIEVTAPILNPVQEEPAGVMLVSISTDIIEDSLVVLDDKADTVLILMGIMVLILACVSGLVMVKPFKRITSSIAAVTEGYDDNYLHENAYTETVLLSDAFNKMLGRMKALDDSRNEFVSNVSHELKTPLTSMKVLSDSLLTQPDAPAELYKEFMGDLSEEIERENKIINDLLSLVKMDKTANTPNVAMENMNELVEKILKRLRPIASMQNIEVVFESFRPVNAEVDEVKISLAITNLVENAIKYTEKGGFISIRVKSYELYTEIQISDNGRGIRQEELTDIFKRFYRSPEVENMEGSGIGLYLCNLILEKEKGYITAISEYGKGSCFSVFLQNCKN